MSKIVQASIAKRKKYSPRDILVDDVTTRLRAKNPRLVWIQRTGGRKNTYFIYDALFPLIWRGMRDNDRKTVGFVLEFERKKTFIGVSTEHLKSPFNSIKKNLSPDCDAIKKSLQRAKSDDTFRIMWSSKSYYKKSDKKEHTIDFDFENFRDLDRKLRSTCKIDGIHMFAKDMGPRVRFTNRDGTNDSSGTYFQIGHYTNQTSADKLARSLQAFRPVFDCLYPPMKLFLHRRADFSRMLKGGYGIRGLPIKCGHLKCEKTDNLQAAHIVAVKAGGPDTIDNGIFLCGDHHKKLEGKSLATYRKSIKVKYRKHTRL